MHRNLSPEKNKTYLKEQLQYIQGQKKKKKIQI